MQVHSWEPSLLSLAYEAVHSVVPAREQFDMESEALTHAYAHAAAVTSMHSRSFYLASSLLPRDKRRAARALYAFCRRVDDIVDTVESGRQSDAAELLSAWRERLNLDHPSSDDSIALAWADTRQRYGIPSKYAEQLLDGVTRDLYQTQYDTFEDLTTYCYGVASTVGLMTMHIVGFHDPLAIPYAIKLGVALQMTNILRDVGEDWQMGRRYLPKDELEAFGVSDQDIAAGRVNDRWRNFMQFQIYRNRSLYAEARPGIHMLESDGRFAIAAAADFYAAILDEIEQSGYDVFASRSHVSKLRKIGMLPGIWYRSRAWFSRDYQEA